MNTIKIALTGVASLGLVVAGAASAEPTRAAFSLPAPVSAKKLKVLRTAAPASRELRAVEGADIGIALLAAGAGGFALYEATKSDDSSGG